MCCLLADHVLCVGRPCVVCWLTMCWRTNKHRHGCCLQASQSTDKASLLSSMEMGKWKTTEEGVVADFSTLGRISEAVRAA